MNADKNTLNIFIDILYPASFKNKSAELLSTQLFVVCSALLSY